MTDCAPDKCDGAELVQEGHPCLTPHPRPRALTPRVRRAAKHSTRRNKQTHARTNEQTSTPAKERQNQTKSAEFRRKQSGKRDARLTETGRILGKTRGKHLRVANVLTQRVERGGQDV